MNWAVPVLAVVLNTASAVLLLVVGGVQFLIARRWKKLMEEASDIAEMYRDSVPRLTEGGLQNSLAINNHAECLENHDKRIAIMEQRLLNLEATKLVVRDGGRTKAE